MDLAEELEGPFRLQPKTYLEMETFQSKAAAGHPMEAVVVLEADSL